VSSELRLVLGQDGLRNLRSAAHVQDEPCLGVEEVPALLAAKEEAGQCVIRRPGDTHIQLLHHGVPTPTALPVGLQKRFSPAMLGGQDIFVPLDEFQVKLGVQLFEDCHEQRIAEWH
jgi:hypothetical protein